MSPGLVISGATIAIDVAWVGDARRQPSRSMSPRITMPGDNHRDRDRLGSLCQATSQAIPLASRGSRNPKNTRDGAWRHFFACFGGNRGAASGKASMVRLIRTQRAKRPVLRSSIQAMRACLRRSRDAMPRTRGRVALMDTRIHRTRARTHETRAGIAVILAPVRSTRQSACARRDHRADSRRVEGARVVRKRATNPRA
jgi:hypothetical protein